MVASVKAKRQRREHGTSREAPLGRAGGRRGAPAEAEFLRARSEEQREVRRRAILDTAAAMLEQMPVAEVGLNELARRVGLAKSNVLLRVARGRAPRAARPGLEGLARGAACRSSASGRRRCATMPSWPPPPSGPTPARPGACSPPTRWTGLWRRSASSSRRRSRQCWSRSSRARWPVRPRRQGRGRSEASSKMGASDGVQLIGAQGCLFPNSSLARVMADMALGQPT
ncbi:TetR family transcriptional regulator [Cystobacter fuscus]|uniref:TetR family transcriptional regulator n=1 Tax=Cystobacter fuscus TaxID=43 RepID=A0A250J8Q4_9BACT|nr:TetR family transcriptional regulator [Cystobacter fuscus]